MTYSPRHLDREAAAKAAREGELVPWQEAAELVGSNSATVARWIDRGQLPFIVLDRRRHVVLWQVSELEWKLRSAGAAKHGKGTTAV